MFISTTMNKSFFVIIFYVLLSMIFSAQKAFAVSLVPISDFDTHMANSNANYNVDDTSPYTRVKQYGNESSFAFFKFDISGLAGTTVNSAVLNLYAKGKNGSNPAIIEMYYVSNDNIYNGGDASYINGLLGLNLIGSASINTNRYSPFSINMTDLLDLNNNIVLKDNYFTLALKLNGNGNGSIMSSDNDSNLPSLEISNTPAPEPSSIILGLVGISSIIGLRRNKSA